MFCPAEEQNCLFCQGGIGCVASQEEDTVQGCDLVGNFQNKVGAASSLRKRSPLLLDDGRYSQFILCSGQPRAACPCSGGEVEEAGCWAAPAWSSCVSPMQLILLSISGGEASSSACCGSHSPYEPHAEETFPSPLAGCCWADT